MEPDPRLNLRVLLIEDESAILLLLEDMLETLGCSVAGTASTLQDALHAARECDAEVAIVDLNLGGKNSLSVAEALRTRKIPVIFSTGYGAQGLGAEWADNPVLSKPYTIEQMGAALQRAAGAR